MKLWLYTVRREVIGELVVMADTEAEAEQLARENCEEIDPQIDEYIRTTLDSEVTCPDDLPPEWEDARPISRDRWLPAGNERTCRELAEELQAESPTRQPLWKKTRDLFPQGGR